MAKDSLRTGKALENLRAANQDPVRNSKISRTMKTHWADKEMRVRFVKAIRKASKKVERVKKIRQSTLVRIKGSKEKKGVCRICEKEFSFKNFGKRQLTCKKCLEATPLCACGCGERVQAIGGSGQESLYKFVRGHQLWPALKKAWKEGRVKVAPNKPERHLNKILASEFPGEFKLNVKGDVIIGGKIPDFVNVNGRKLLVEMFGNFWHGKEWTGVADRSHERTRKNYFAKWGYRTVVVWERELKDVGKLALRLRKEIGG